MSEWLRNLELALTGSPVRSEHHFEAQPQLNEGDDAKSLETRVKSYLALREHGLMSDEQIRLALDLG